MTLAEFVGRYFSVRKCPACGALLPYERKNEAFCDSCRLKWEVAKTHECKRCGQVMCECICMTRTLSDAGTICHHKAVSYSSYLPVVHNTMMFIKRNANSRVTDFLASQLVGVIKADGELPMLERETALISFVPRGRKAVFRYGVDQSERMAESVGKLMGIDFAATLKRVGDGKEQKKLSAAQRAKNAKKLYAPVEDIERLVSGRNVILIDDIVTTGASMAACVSYLIRAGAKTVTALSVASTEENK